MGAQPQLEQLCKILGMRQKRKKKGGKRQWEEISQTLRVRTQTLRVSTQTPRVSTQTPRASTQTPRAFQHPFPENQDLFCPPSSPHLAYFHHFGSETLFRDSRDFGWSLLAKPLSPNEYLKTLVQVQARWRCHRSRQETGSAGAVQEHEARCATTSKLALNRKHVQPYEGPRWHATPQISFHQSTPETTARDEQGELWHSQHAGSFAFY